MKYNRGFTLIELLVVVFIIGLLAAVILASLGTARTKASDAAAKSDMVSIRNQAQMSWNDNGGSYVNVCADTLAIAQAGLANGHYTVLPVCNYDPVTETWAEQVLLKSGASNYWCIDYTQTAKTENVALAGTVCP